MEGRAIFRNEALADMVAVGRVEARAARLWLRAARPGRVVVSWWPEGEASRRHEGHVDVAAGDGRDQTASVGLPMDGAVALRPATRYRFEVRRADDGRAVGAGGFETAPATPEATPARFAFALMSCHQPFDDTGAVHAEARPMLRAAQRCLEAHDAKFVLMVGDQLYADHPPGRSLFDPIAFSAVAPPGRASILECNPAEVRRLYQQHYRHFWGIPELQAIQASYPCYMMLDDHDVVNNWGSNPAHLAPPWSTVGEGALRAFQDYQSARVQRPSDALPEDFHYSFAYGHTAAFVMDLRTGRRAGADARLLGDAQVTDLQAFLHAHRRHRVLLLVLSVPLLHVPGRLARLGARLPAWGEDFSDRWSAEAHRRDRDRVLGLLHAHQCRYPSQRLVLLSGDIHIGCLHRIAWPAPAPPLYQFIASPLTHRTPRWVQSVSRQMIRLQRRVATRDGHVGGRVDAVPGEAGCRHNLYGGLNVGIVEVETPALGGAPTLRFLLYGHDGDEPVCVYRSPPL